MNGKRVSIAPQNEHPDTSLESFSELLFVLSSMSFRRVLWAWVKGGTGLAPLGLALCWRILWLVLALCWAILAQSCDNLATRWSPRAPGWAKIAPKSANMSKHSAILAPSWRHLGSIFASSCSKTIVKYDDFQMRASKNIVFYDENRPKTICWPDSNALHHFLQKPS